MKKNEKLFAQAFEDLAGAYFTDCQGQPLFSPEGEPVLDKAGEPIRVGVRPPTPAGLAYALQFSSLEELFTAASGKDEVARVLRRCLLRCRGYAEERLYDKDGRQGAEFSLQHHFRLGEGGDAAGETGVVELPLVNEPEENGF